MCVFTLASNVSMIATSHLFWHRGPSLQLITYKLTGKWCLVWHVGLQSFNHGQTNHVLSLPANSLQDYETRQEGPWTPIEGKLKKKKKVQNQRSESFKLPEHWFSSAFIWSFWASFTHLLTSGERPHQGAWSGFATFYSSCGCVTASEAIYLNLLGPSKGAFSFVKTSSWCHSCIFTGSNLRKGSDKQTNTTVTVIVGGSNALMHSWFKITPGTDS